MRHTSIISLTLGFGLLTVSASAQSRTAPTTPAQSAPATTAPLQSAPPKATPAVPDEANQLPSLPATPVGIEEIVVARPFVVLEPWSSDWNAERAEVERGWVVVLRVAPALAVPRQTQEPVLYAGAHTVERVMSSPESNLILAIVPATLRAEAVPGHAAGVGGPAPRGSEEEPLRPLAELAFWFGTAELPEQVDRAAVSREIANAQTAAIAPRALEEVVRALKQGGSAIAVVDRDALLAVIEPWAEQHGVVPANTESAPVVTPVAGDRKANPAQQPAAR